ncbi:hypothetical protein FQR65_LT04190 [Abscondita terminalis]|nr:hypothetical protein FQR65_LT04190 [Abscondita terminalis]
MWVKVNEQPGVCLYVTMDVDDFHTVNPTTRLVEVGKFNSESCGFHLTRSKWDPYPWVCKVDEGTAAELAGMQPGECVLEINGEDIVGKRISEIAERVRSGSNQISLLLWNSGVDTRCSPESLCCGSMPQNLQRLTTCMSSILSVLECPVCLDTISPPVYQCDNGHLVCLRCRTRTERCPVCRIRLTKGRSLLAEQVYHTISDVFELNGDSQQNQKTKIQSIFKLNAKKKNVPDIKVTQSPTNKFLAKIIGKSSSVDNLSNDHKAAVTARHVLENNFGNTLKAKSLSTSEIFKTSPCNSRTGSFHNINGTRYVDKRFLNLENGDDSGPASYHGSTESMDQSLNLEVAATINVKVLYPCPYLDTCTTTIKDFDMIKHFQDAHNGPLVQYFQSKVQLPFRILRSQDDICYVLHAMHNTFFLRIMDSVPKQLKRKGHSGSDVLLWIWILSDENVSNDFRFQVEIFNAKEEELLRVSSPVYSLWKKSWKNIIGNKQGLFLNLDMLEQFGADTLIVEVLKVDDEKI